MSQQLYACCCMTLIAAAEYLHAGLHKTLSVQVRQHLSCTCLSCLALVAQFKRRPWLHTVTSCSGRGHLHTTALTRSPGRRTRGSMEMATRNAVTPRITGTAAAMATMKTWTGEIVAAGTRTRITTAMAMLLLPGRGTRGAMGTIDLGTQTATASTTAAAAAMSTATAASATPAMRTGT